MRAILLLAFVGASLPVILFQPYYGVLLWTWFSLMNPHKLAWGFVKVFPFAKILGAVTIFAALNPSVAKRSPLTRETVALAMFVLWMVITTVFALNELEAWAQLSKVLKIQLVLFITLMLMTTRKRLDLFVWMIVGAIGFYGVKGGIFTLLTGGKWHVNGPEKSFIAGGNHLGLALVMVIPLMRYVQKTSPNRFVRWGLTGAMILSSIATLGTQSRGAMLGLVAVGIAFMWKGRGRLALGALAVVLLLLAPVVMPQSWFDRMDTIRNYQEDGSAMGRINAWGFAVNLALDRPLVGGGFQCFRGRWFDIYAPDPTDVHDAHSIYFEVLGEQGFVGLALFLTLLAFTWRTCTKLQRQADTRDETSWVSDLARMLQVGFVGYAVAGAFVGLAYFDLFYNMVAVAVAAKLLLREATEELEEDEPVQWQRRLSAASG